MVVRIRLGERPKPAAKRARNRRLVQGVGALLTPAALMALALGIWGIGADLKLTTTFAIGSGWFSHWHVWLGIAVVLKLGSIALNRSGQKDSSSSSEASRVGSAGRAKPPERTAAGLP